MDNYIMFEGKKIPLTDEQVKIMLEVETLKSPFKRVERGSIYYLIYSNGEAYHEFDVQSSIDDDRYKVANYCTDETLMTKRALHETLNRLLWRFSIENGEGENPWDGNHNHYDIYWSYNTESFEVIKCNYSKVINSVYFPSKELAQRAINEIVKPFMEAHPEFVL